MGRSPNQRGAAPVRHGVLAHQPRTEVNDQITKADLESFKQELKTWILEREVNSVRWMVGTQIAYFAITLSAVWFLLTHH